MSNIKISEPDMRLVEKPTRYTGGEYNEIVKENASYRFALCFPDVYEIGMSHLGSKILYNIINQMDDVACERAYAPWIDMREALIKQNLKLRSLETKLPLDEFDALGFSLLYELCYTNILSMLELSGIPLKAKDRNENHPIIIAGGPCVCNPEPVAPFFDVMLFGDGEYMMTEVIKICKESKEQGLSKSETIAKISNVKGAYIPAYYEAEYDGLRFKSLKKLNPNAPDKIERQIVKDLDSAEYIGKPIVPYMQIVHDRVPLELFRGCTRGCRFCQAGFIYRPIRERKPETIMKQARELIKCTGYDEISLFSLSSGDYSHIREIVPALIDEFRAKNVSLSLPSLRIDSFLKDSLEQISSIRKTGLTFAPEAGTQRLRDVINKGVTEKDLLESVREAFESGWSSVKLYFMIGLPTETDEDVVGIIELAKKVREEYYKLPPEKRTKAPRIAVSVSSFVPKPFTPFQWFGQDTREELERKQGLLKTAVRSARGVELSYHDSAVSVLESVFARGDRRLSDAIEYAYKHGALFDSWDEYFKPELWQEAFDNCGIDRFDIAHRERDTNEPLPWSHMDCLVVDKYLMNEYEKAKHAETTKDCRKGCNGCFGGRYADYCKY